MKKKRKKEYVHIIPLGVHVWLENYGQRKADMPITFDTKRESRRCQSGTVDRDSLFPGFPENFLDATTFDLRMIPLPRPRHVYHIATERLGQKVPGWRLSKTESRETSCVTAVLEFRCSQQRDSLSSSGRTLLNILVDDKAPSAALSPPLVFEEQRDSLRGLPGDCNNIFCAEAYEGCATNARAVSSRAALRDVVVVVVRHARGRNDMRLSRLSDGKRNLFYTG